LRSHTYVCIECPLSCKVELQEENGKISEIKNNRCRRGKEYVISEFTDPKRILTTTVVVENGRLPVIPVRSTAPVPKKLIKECMKELARIRLKAPIKCGDLVCANILNTEMDIIASRDLEEGGKK
jgi:CxxC motif-containing protein